MKKITLTQIIDQYIRACGPVSFAGIMHEVKTQHGDAPEHEVAAALTGLLRTGHAVLYDDGTSFNVGPAADAVGPIRAEPDDCRCPDCGASASQPGVVCRVCRRGITAAPQKER